MNQNPNYSPYEPWNQDTYRTGSTRPPKKRWGLIAVLLTLVILLAGLSTILGLANIRLLGRLSESEIGETLPIHFSNTAQKNDTPFPVASVPTAAQPDATQAPIQPPVELDTQPAGTQPAEGGDMLSLQEIYETVIPSVVSISCVGPSGGTGTGVILTQDGYIVTNCHVVEGAQAIQVLLSDGRNIHAELVGLDDVSDLAVLRIQATDLIPARLGDSAAVRVGDSVVAIGDPLGIALRGTMTDGIISAINRDVDVDGRTMSLLQTNAALNSGNSGGPLINRYGQVIGINTMKMSSSLASATVEGLGFAIPSATVQEITNQLILQGYISGRPSLGITGEAVSTFGQLYYYLPRGLQITEVAEGSCAQTAGLQKGDIVLSIDGVSVTDSASLRTVLYNYKPGDEVTVVIYRGGRRYTGTIVLDEAGA